MNIIKQITLMESLDSKESKEAYLALENFVAEGTFCDKNQIFLGNGINHLVDHYANGQSIRALKLLCTVQEPYDKILLDKMMECMNRNSKDTFVLLGQIVQKAPGWLPKFIHHQLFRCILELIRPNKNLELVNAAIFFISSILPYSSTITEPIFEDIFYAFLEACTIFGELQFSNKANILMINDEILLSNLKNEISTSSQPAYKEQKQDFKEREILKIMITKSQRIALFKLFQIIYGMFPGNMIFLLRY